MRYRRGAEFDALEELAGLQDTLTSQDELAAWASLLLSLQDMQHGGFTAAGHAWDETGQDEIWIFSDPPIRCAIRVPGDGRAQTFDAVLLMTRCLARPTDAERQEFLDEASRRLRTGEDVPWE